MTICLWCFFWYMISREEIKKEHPRKKKMANDMLHIMLPLWGKKNMLHIFFALHIFFWGLHIIFFEKTPEADCLHIVDCWQSVSGVFFGTWFPAKKSMKKTKKEKNGQWHVAHNVAHVKKTKVQHSHDNLAGVWSVCFICAVIPSGKRPEYK